jgi:hypothetical protein
MSEGDNGRRDGTAAWHRRLHHTGHDQLSPDTAQTPRMRRYEAISGTRNGSRKIWMGESRIDPGMVSGDHSSTCPASGPRCPSWTGWWRSYRPRRLRAHDFITAVSGTYSVADPNRRAAPGG